MKTGTWKAGDIVSTAKAYVVTTAPVKWGEAAARGASWPYTSATFTSAPWAIMSSSFAATGTIIAGVGGKSGWAWAWSEESGWFAAKISEMTAIGTYNPKSKSGFSPQWEQSEMELAA